MPDDEVYDVAPIDYALPEGVDRVMRHATPADTARVQAHYTAMADQLAREDAWTHVGVLLTVEDILLIQAALGHLSSIDYHHLYERLERGKAVLARRERYGF